MKYQANPVEVDAFKIASLRTPFPDKRIELTLDEGQVVIAIPEMTARMNPHVGDYWVIQSDGYTYLNPKDVFERKYSPVELNALELGAAVRRAGLAGK